jgi:hypothetical protein
MANLMANNAAHRGDPVQAIGRELVDMFSKPSANCLHRILSVGEAVAVALPMVDFWPSTMEIFEVSS